MNTRISKAVVSLLVFFVVRTADTDETAMRSKYESAASQYIETASGLSVHYRDEGCSDCPAIVLVHGSNASLQTFEPLIKVLGDRYRLISYDQPGHGLTGPHPNDDYSAKGMFEAIDAVISATGVEQFALAGNSMGGWLAWRFTLAQPEKVSALILMNSSGAPPRPGAEAPRLYLGARIMQYSAGRFLARHITPRSVVEQSVFDNFVDKSKVSDVMVDRYWELLRFPGNRRAAGLRATADRETQFAQRLHEIAAPTLILWGAEDTVTPAYNANTFQEMIADSKLQIFPNVGHLTMEEVPEKTAAAMNLFLESSLSAESLNGD